jgi:hypothetical protein
MGRALKTIDLSANEDDICAGDGGGVCGDIVKLSHSWVNAIYGIKYL